MTSCGHFHWVNKAKVCSRGQQSNWNKWYNQYVLEGNICCRQLLQCSWWWWTKDTVFMLDMADCISIYNCFKGLLCRHIAPTRWHCFHFPQIDKCRASTWSERLSLSCPAFPIQADIFGPKNRLDRCQSVHLVQFYQMEDLRSRLARFYKELEKSTTLAFTTDKSTVFEAKRGVGGGGNRGIRKNEYSSHARP